MTTCAVCQQPMQERCGEFTCGYCYGRALEANTLPRTKSGGNVEVVVTFDGHAYVASTRVYVE